MGLQVRQLRRELVQRQQKSVRDLLMAAQVVLCTNTGYLPYISPISPLYLAYISLYLAYISACEIPVDASCGAPMRSPAA